MIKTIIASICLCLGAPGMACAQQQLRVYPAPAGAPLNHDFTLLVRSSDTEWQQVPTYLWKVDNAETGKHKVEQTSVASFDFSGSVELAVVSQRQHVATCRVRPLSYNIPFTLNGDTIRFSLDRSRYISVEVNGDLFHNLQIFANPMTPMLTKKQQRSKDVIYFGPGYYDMGKDSLAIPSGKTVYIDGGAYISINDAVYWADVAHPIMIGLHGDIEKNEVIEDVVYDDIDILENPEKQIDYKGCIGINNGDNNLVRRITFQNIRIEDLHRGGMLFNFRVCFNKKYCAAPGRGIHDITLRNISYRGVKPEFSIMTGYSPDRQIRGIRFENLSINGQLITDDMPERLAWFKTSDYAGIFVGEHVEDITFTK